MCLFNLLPNDTSVNIKELNSSILFVCYAYICFVSEYLFTVPSGKRRVLNFSVYYCHFHKFEITSCELTVGRDLYSLGRASGTFQCLSL